MYLRLSLILALKLLLIVNSYAFQSDSTQPWKVHIDNRFQFVDKEVMEMLGTSAGYSWGKQEDEITIGYYWLNNNGRQALDWTARRKQGYPVTDFYERLDKFRFVSVGYWYHFYDSERWKFGVPVELGYGNGVVRYFSGSAEPLSGYALKQSVFPVHIAGYGEWRTTKWVGAGLQVGYRHYLNGHQSFEGMHGLFYRVRITGYIQAFSDWKDYLFKKKKLNSPFY